MSENNDKEEGYMYRDDALKIIAEKFPETTVTETDYINGGTREVHWTAEKRLDKMIELAEPSFDGLKEGSYGIPKDFAKWFIRTVEYDYKNEFGLWA